MRIPKTDLAFDTGNLVKVTDPKAFNDFMEKWASALPTSELPYLIWCKACQAWHAKEKHVSNG